MASQEGKGSILLKSVIVLFVIVLILVIRIPGEIWQEEEEIQKISRGNMATLYDAYRYFHNLKDGYPSDKEELITTIQNDSALIKRQLVVNHSRRLINAIEAFKEVPPVDNLREISANLKNIEDDFTLNKRFFITIENIDREAEDIKMQLASFRSGVDFQNYHFAELAMDSLWQLRRDLSDYSLQSAARFSSSFAKDVAIAMPQIDFNAMNKIWIPLSKRINDLMSAVNNTRLKNLTSVADRVADFQQAITEGFNYFTNNRTITMNDVNSKVEDLETVYNIFLSDFLITEEYAQYSLTESDSLLINLSERSFYTPDQKLPYVISFGDSVDLRVEDPTLLADLKERAKSEAEKVSQLAFMEVFENYQNPLQNVRNFYPQIKERYRRNIEITIKNKEIEEILNNIPGSVVFGAYLKTKAFTDIVPTSDSYSEIRNEVESTLLNIGTFKQVYGDNFFGNFDTLHTELIMQLDNYNNILSQIRRNPFSFDEQILALNTAFDQIKSVPKESVLPALDQIEKNMQDIYLFASEGKEESVYGIFSKKTVNQGSIYGPTGRKSWEEE